MSSPITPPGTAAVKASGKVAQKNPAMKTMPAELDENAQKAELRSEEARVITLKQLLLSLKERKAAIIAAYFEKTQTNLSRQGRQRWWRSNHAEDHAAIAMCDGRLHLAQQRVCIPEGMSKPRRCCGCKGLVGRVFNHMCNTCKRACHLRCTVPMPEDNEEADGQCSKCCAIEQRESNSTGAPTNAKPTPDDVPGEKSTGTPESAKQPTIWDKSRSQMLQLKPSGLKGEALFNHMCMLRRRQHGAFAGAPELDLATNKKALDLMYANIEQDIVSGNLLREAAGGGRDGKIKIQRTLDYLGEWKADPKLLTDPKRQQKLERFQRLLKNILTLKVTAKTATDLKKAGRKKAQEAKKAKKKRGAKLRCLFVTAGIIADGHKGKLITKKIL